MQRHVIMRRHEVHPRFGAVEFWNINREVADLSCFYFWVFWINYKSRGNKGKSDFPPQSMTNSVAETLKLKILYGQVSL